MGLPERWCVSVCLFRSKRQRPIKDTTPFAVNVPDWDYSDGYAYSNTTENLAAYYGRLLSWIVKGYLIDEFGKVEACSFSFFDPF